MFFLFVRLFFQILIREKGELWQTVWTAISPADGAIASRRGDVASDEVLLALCSLLLAREGRSVLHACTLDLLL